MIQLLECYSLHLILIPKTSLDLLKYSFVSLSFSFSCCMSKFSSIPKYLYPFLGSSYVTSFSNVLRICILLWPLPLFKHILAHFSKPKLLLLLLLLLLVLTGTSSLSKALGCDIYSVSGIPKSSNSGFNPVHLFNF